eukprot:m.180464 g.180464  ORF g.180464 m.180464 type:complete len:785 (-) comp16615_c1_seq1:608-2962(-)
MRPPALGAFSYRSLSPGRPILLALFVVAVAAWLLPLPTAGDCNTDNTLTPSVAAAVSAAVSGGDLKSAAGLTGSNTTINSTAALSTTTPPSEEDDDDPPLWQTIVTLILIVAMLVAMATEVAPPDMLMMGTVILFVPMGIITIEEAVVGFSNTGMLTVAVLFPVAAGVQMTGAFEPLRRLLERRTQPTPGSAPFLPRVIAWIMLPVGLLSTFLNNTPVVAMMIPVVEKLGRQLGIAPSKLLLPLSYASILGGTCSLIGTSTNLVLVGLVEQRIQGFSMGMFEITRVGLPVFFAGLIYILLLAGKLLPNRQSVTTAVARPREYITCMFVKEESNSKRSLNGKTVEEAGLRNLPGLFLIQVERENGTTVTAPGPECILQTGDKLYFAGKVDSVLSLSQVRGLRLAEDDEDEIDLHRLTGNDVLVEAVVAPHSALVHRSVKDTRFRTRYKAAIIAVHRHGVRINQRIGDIVLEGGDSLLLVANKDFMTLYQNQDHFALVSAVDGHVNMRWSKAPLAVTLAIAMIAVSAANVIDLLTAAIFTIAALVLFRCMSASEVRAAIDLKVLLVIAGAFGLSNALINSGAARLMAQGVVLAAKPTGTAGLYIMVYLTTGLLTEVVTNNAAVTLMFPVVFQAAQDLNTNFYPLLLLLMMAGSASFMTPTGYQTNLMVYGPGGYAFVDFFKFGAGLQLFVGAITIAVVATLDFWWLWFIALFLTASAVFLLMPRPSAASQTHGDTEQQSNCPPVEPMQAPDLYFYQPDLGLAKVERFDDEEQASSDPDENDTLFST